MSENKILYAVIKTRLSKGDVVFKETVQTFSNAEEARAFLDECQKIVMRIYFAGLTGMSSDLERWLLFVILGDNVFPAWRRGHDQKAFNFTVHCLSRLVIRLFKHILTKYLFCCDKITAYQLQLG